MRLLHRLLALPPISRLPVRVRGGIATGARWSLYPLSSYWRGTHEPEIQQRLLSIWDWTGRNAWDLGAHYGLFAIGLARLTGPAGRVAAFEPNPASFARLHLHAERNPMPWLRLFPQAASDRTGFAPLVHEPGDDTTTAHLPYDGEVLTPATPRLEIPTVRLDDLLVAGDLPPPHFIKLDVEGHGHRVLAGAARAIRDHRPVLLTGLHSPQEIDGIRALLIPLGYRPEPATPRTPATLSCGGDYFWHPEPDNPLPA